MHIGESVMVPVNGGQLKRGVVIDIKGDTVTVAGPEEIKIVTAKGRSPIGVGFRREDIQPVSE